MSFGGTHFSSVQALCSRHTGPSGGLFSGSPFHEGAVRFTGSALLSAAAGRAAFCFIFCLFLICFLLGLIVLAHKDFICYLQQLCGIHPSEAFQLLEVSLDVCTGLSHKGSVNHPLILGCLRVEWGICLGHFTQSFTEIGGSLIRFLDYHCNLGRIGGLFGSHS